MSCLCGCKPNKPRLVYGLNTARRALAEDGGVNVGVEYQCNGVGFSVDSFEFLEFGFR